MLNTIDNEKKRKFDIIKKQKQKSCSLRKLLTCARALTLLNDASRANKQTNKQTNKQIYKK